jgi:hypothetical protein
MISIPVLKERNTEWVMKKSPQTTITIFSHDAFGKDNRSQQEGCSDAILYHMSRKHKPITDDELFTSTDWKSSREIVETGPIAFPENARRFSLHERLQ